MLIIVYVYFIDCDASGSKCSVQSRDWVTAYNYNSLVMATKNVMIETLLDEYLLIDRLLKMSKILLLMVRHHTKSPDTSIYFNSIVVYGISDVAGAYLISADDQKNPVGVNILSVVLIFCFNTSYNVIAFISCLLSNITMCLLVMFVQLLQFHSLVAPTR